MTPRLHGERVLRQYEYLLLRRAVRKSSADPRVLGCDERLELAGWCAVLAATAALDLESDYQIS
jgi:hypothetical protein